MAFRSVFGGLVRNVTMRDEHWAHRLLSADRVPSPPTVSEVRSAIRWRSLSEEFVLLGSVSRDESASVYPDALRRVTYLDVEKNKRFKFLTNNFTLPAPVIAQIYKSRWAVELFFKWIKQHLRIKAFYGTSENAVKTQI